jgi:hypothetical protein
MMTDKTDDKVEDKVEDKEVDKVEEDKPVEPVLSEVEQSAVTFGWQPKEAWIKDGKAEDDWVPAKQFMKFGDLKQQLISKDKQLGKAEKIMKMMKDHHLKVREDAYKDAVRALKAEKKAALESNDMALVEHIKDRIDEEKERFEKNKALPPEIENAAQEVVVPNTPPAEFFDFQDRNPWYKMQNQDELSVEADKIGIAEFEYERIQAQTQRRQPDLNKVYKAVETKIRKLFPEKFATQKSPQSDTGTRTSNTSKSPASKLTEDQLQVAKAFGISPEKYAEQANKYKGR